MTINGARSTNNTSAKKSGFGSFISGILTSGSFWLLAACGAFRLGYYSLLTDTIAFDSELYLYYQRFYRTPVYPYFIKFVKLFGAEHLTHNVIIAQSFISFLAIIVFYKTASLVLKNRAVAFIAALVYGIQPSLISFDKCILTESLSISAMTVFLYFIARYLKKPAEWKAVLSSLYVFFLIMLRPAFTGLLPVLFAFWGLRMIFFKNESKICRSGLTALLTCIFLLQAYSAINYISYGSYGITTISQINQIDIIINSDMYMDGDDPEISKTIKTNLPEPHGPWNENIRNILFAGYSRERIGIFIRHCITNQPVTYLRQAAKKISYLSKVKLAVSFAAPANHGAGEWEKRISLLLSFPFIVIYILMLSDFIYLATWWHRSRQILWHKLLLWATITAQFTTVIIGAQSEYQRLLVEILPAVILSIFSYLDFSPKHRTARN